MTFLSNPLTTPFFLYAAIGVGARIGFHTDLAAFVALRGESVSQWMAVAAVRRRAGAGLGPVPDRAWRGACRLYRVARRMALVGRPQMAPAFRARGLSRAPTRFELGEGIMIRWMVFLAASTALAACTASPPPEVAASGRSGRGCCPGAGTRAQAELGTFGFDTAGMDKTVLPGDNFYQYANGTWARNTPIPADKSNYGMFTTLDDLSKERTRAIIEEAAKDPNSKIGNAYNSFLDTAAIEAKGLAPIQPWLDRGQGPQQQVAAMPRLPPRPTGSASGIPFGLFVGQDDKNPDRYVTAISPGRHRHARPRLLSVGRSEDRRGPRQISAASDQHPDAGRRSQCRCARQGDPRFRNRRSPRSTGPRSKAATRPRPTI